MIEALPAFLSAVAASFAAISSLVLLRIHRRDSVESVRPELVLDGWARNEVGSGDSRREEISIGTVRNVGRGAAFQIFLLLEKPGFDDEPIKATMLGSRVPILATGEEKKINCQVTVWWKNVNTMLNDGRYLSLTILIYSWDRAGLRHETRYTLFAEEPGRRFDVAGASEILPGLSLTFRRTTSRSVRSLKVRRKFLQMRTRFNPIRRFR